MNINDPNSSKDPKQPSSKPPEKQPGEPSPSITPPIAPPLSSPSEPTRAYPAEPSRTYSSDPSQYAYPNKPSSESSNGYKTEPLDTARVSDHQTKSEGASLKDRENQKKYQEASEDKARETYRDKQESPSSDNLYTYAKSNKEQTITYILLALGLLFLLFFNNLLGGLIIGMVAGYYFAAEIIYYIRNMNQIVKGQDQVRYIVLTALLLGLFIAAPGIFIGAAIVAVFKQVMAGPRDPSNRY